jgi:sensor histidine kinase YesM
MKIFKLPSTELDLYPEKTKRFRKREIVVRFACIIVMGSVCPFLEPGYTFNKNTYLISFLANTGIIALIWHGSMYIIQYSLTIFSVFKYPLKLILTQVGALTVLVLVVETTGHKVMAHLINKPVDQVYLKSSIITALLITYLISLIYASIGFFMQWKENLLKNRELEKANLEAQYETLKNQVNPHFLFNSLNTLLTMVGDNKDAAKYVESLADFMRYVLQTREKEAVLLRDELKIANEYLFIQKNRFGEKLLVEMNVPESAFHYAIPPLALQMLIENAIKHNVASKENRLKIEIYIADGYLVIENNILEKLDKEAFTGVGLANIRSRYTFLTGKDVIITNENGTFTVKLPLVEISL